MMYVIRVAAVLKATNIILDSEFAILEDGNYPDKPYDNLKTVQFLNCIEVLKEGFENHAYSIKLKPVRYNSCELFYPLVEEEKRQRYVAKSKLLADILQKFGKKLGIEFDPSKLSEFQREGVK